MSKILSGKVKKIPSSAVSADRYNFLQLSEAEPDLGVPAANGYILTSDTSGNRSWVNRSTLSEGTDIDQVKSLTKTLTLTTEWQDTGIKATDLATGTYLVQLYANDSSAGGNNNNEYYSGTMSWYSGATDSSVTIPTDEIILHRAGASSDGGLYLRTYRSPSTDPSALKLQIYANIANSSSSNYVFKFRRMM
jgi:hypothetical protein